MTDITESNWREILRSNYADLLVKIDSNSEGGLKGEFIKLGLFTSQQIKNIWVSWDFYFNLFGIIRICPDVYLILPYFKLIHDIKKCLTISPYFCH